jgi:hypothetical protein
MRRVLRLAVLVLVIGVPVVAGIGALVGGAPAALGAALGLLLPLLFLGVTVAVALGTARMAPGALGAVVLGSWLVKLILLVAALALLDRSDAWSRPAFFTTFVLGVVGWLVVEGFVVVRTRVPYVDATTPIEGRAGAADRPGSTP